MGLRDTLYFWSLTLLTLPGIICQQSIRYPQQNICTTEGSTVTIPCMYDLPKLEFFFMPKLTRALWCFNQDQHFCPHGHHVYSSESKNIPPEYRNRAECLRCTEQDCTLTINNIRHRDSGTYTFQLETVQDAKWTGWPGVSLMVAELHVLVTSSRENGSVINGDSVELTCMLSCLLSQSELIWFKNNQPLHWTGSKLHLNSVSRQHSGNYFCALKDNVKVKSSFVFLDVQYPPRNMSVWVSPSGEPVEGSSVTLTCSSEANPPADSYTWFKTGAVALVTGRGQSYTIINIRPEDSGLYYCRAENKHGALNSDARTLTVAAETNTTFLTVIWIVLAVLAVTVAATVITIFVKRRKATQRGERTQTGHPDPHNDLYMTLDLKSRSPDYDTLKTVRDAAKPSSSSQNHSTFTVYENIQERHSAERKT